MAEEEEQQEQEENEGETLQPSFPLGRIKRIMKLDEDIKKVNSESLLLVTLATDLFLQFLAGKSAQVATEKKRKTVKLEHIRVAVKRHQPTNDFLLDSLPTPSQSTVRSASTSGQKRSCPTSEKEKSAPVGTRRMEDFFSKAPNLPNQ